MTEKIEKAKALSLKVHEGHMYGNTFEPMTFHITGVVFLATEFAKSATANPHFKEAIVVTAWLHDTVEDTDVTIEEVKKEFGHFVGEAIEAITHLKGETYTEYIEKVGKNDIATVVKLADLRFNAEQTKKDVLYDYESKSGGINNRYTKKCLDRYELAMMYLKKVQQVF